MSSYYSLIKFTCTKNLTDRDSPKKSAYTSPTLLILFEKLTYFKKPKTDQFCTSSPTGGTHTQGASQSADTANWTQEYTSQKCTLNS